MIVVMVSDILGEPKVANTLGKSISLAFYTLVLNVSVMGVSTPVLKKYFIK